VAPLLALSLSALGACGGGSADAGPSIATGPLGGMVGGKPWTVMTAETDAFLSTGDTFFATLYAETFTPCTGAGSSSTGDHLIMSIPKAVGDHSLSFSLTETFFIRSAQDNLIATRGHVRVDTVTDASVAGGAAFTYDDMNTANCQFHVTVCP